MLLFVLLADVVRCSSLSKSYLISSLSLFRLL